ncbi:ClpP/crotonase [Abortiporus biennis]|nr:ClpP/crotonase [Abortiporus biennis]
MSFPVSFPVNQPLVTVTHPEPALWIIELHNGADSRLTTTLISNGLMPALDAVERDWRNGFRASLKSKDKTSAKGTLIIVGNTSQDKFFSNGLAFEQLSADPPAFANFFPVVYNPMLRRLLSFPIPTIAAINGHCFAGGMILALACDYRVMTDGNKKAAWICMNEVHFGAPLPLSFTAMINAKIPDPRTRRKVALQGHRFSPVEALQTGIVDFTVAGGTQGVLSKAKELAASVNELPKLGAYGLIRRELYRDVMEASARDVDRPSVAADDNAAKARL